MKSIYILLTKSDTVVSKAIHLVTADQYTHVSISFDKTLQPLYSFSRKYIYLPLLLNRKFSTKKIIQKLQIKKTNGLRKMPFQTALHQP